VVFQRSCTEKDGNTGDIKKHKNLSKNLKCLKKLKHEKMNLKSKPFAHERLVKITKYFSKNRDRDAHGRDAINRVSTGVRFFLAAAFFAIGFFAFSSQAHAATAIYYSIGQSVADLKTGTLPTVTIASGVATFSAAQTGNIGVGDRVTYNTTDIAYIASKTSTSVWNLVTKTGAVPADITTSTVVSIKHEYTSLSAAVAGAVDANHLNTTDLVTGNYQLNFPCYYDSGADTTSVVVSGYTTGVSNFIKIYTPVSTSNEVNVSQRHNGKTNGNNYIIKPTTGRAISIGIKNIRIDGLEIDMITSNNFGIILNYSVTDVYDSYISNNIIANLSGDWAGLIECSNGGVGSKLYIFNNILSNVIGSNEQRAIRVNGANLTTYIYNNTFYNVARGIWSNAGAIIIAKNNIVQICTNYCYLGVDASSVNNISSDATSPNISLRNKIVAFADYANKDFHLSPTDTSAKNAGADLSVDANLPVTTDIDGQTRPTGAGVVDIGADEAATAIYYSVGQNTNSHETGAGTVTVDATARTATFSVAQTATNMGVGDLITYAGGACYITNKTSTSVWGCQTATGTSPTAATNVDVTSIAHAYASLSTAEAGAVDAAHLNTTDLVTGNYQLNFPCYYDTGADTTNVGVAGYTTGVSNYIKIYTPNNTSTEVNQSQRHSGKWDDGKYKLVPATGTNALYINNDQDYTVIEGLQISVAGTLSTNAFGNSYADYVTLKNSILKRESSTTGHSGIAVRFGYNFKSFNNIIYNFDVAGLSIDQQGNYSNNVYYNNTMYGCGTGAYFGGTNMYKSLAGFGNNIAFGNVIDYNVVSAYLNDGKSSVNNISSDATANNLTNPVNSKINQTVSFVDAANKDFHLSPSDTSAKNSGSDLSADANFAFNTDIEGQARPSSSNVTWDIGADEAATAIFYSVGQNTNSHETGAGTVTVDATARTATFSVAQTATNMGVGDLVTYAGGACYITNKTSTSVWGCQTAIGAAPTAVTDADVTSIAHAYSSLSAAEAGAVDATHLNTTDLVAGNYQLNFPCYYDTGADTTAVTVSGYTTSPANYIRIYTPNNVLTEVNQSQRHQGKWDNQKFNIQVNAAADYMRGIRVNAVDFVRIDGLQVSNTNNDYNYNVGIYLENQKNGAQCFVSNNILRGIFSTTNNDGQYGVFVLTANNLATYYIFNNIVYDMGFGSINGSGIYMYGTNYVYNNTVSNCGDMGIKGVNGIFNLKNNLLQQAPIAYSASYISSGNIINGSQSLGTAALGATVAASGTNSGSVINQITDASANFLTTAKLGMIVKDSNAGYAYITAINSNTNVSLSASILSNPETYTIYTNLYRDVSFIDAPNKNFHLAFSDTSAKNSGSDLSADVNFAFDTDIDGQVRVNPWDIGADQFSDTVLQTQQSSPNLDAGLVGHWTFDGDDTSGTVTKDVSGNANDGVIFGATVTPGKLGQGLSFDGTSDYVEVSDNNVLDLSGNLTLSVWIKPPLPSSINTIVSKGALGGGSNYGISVELGKIWFYTIGTSNANWNTNITAATYCNEGCIITATYDGANKKVFINGVVMASLAATGTPSVNNNTLRIGRDSVNYYYTGIIDDVRIYNRALSATEIGQLYTQGQTTMQTSQNNKSTDGLVGLWSFDGPDVSGTTAFDRSGLGNNGTISGATVTPGKIRQGMKFNGTSDYVDCGTNSSILSDTTTVSAWVKYDGSQSNAPLLRWSTNTAPPPPSLHVEYTGASNGPLLYLGNTEWRYFSPTNPVNIYDNNWHQMIFVVENNDVDGSLLFVDGQQQAISTTDTSGGAAIKTRLDIGRSGSSNYFNGSLDDVRIYNRALSASEISNLYNTGKVEMRR